jgi:hypothetical protein
MKAFGIFVLFLAGALLASALLLYPTWLALSFIAEVPPHKLLHPLAKVLALIYFFVLIRQLGMNDRAALGFGLPRRRFLREMGRGWVLGVLMLLVLSAALMGLGVRTPDPAHWHLRDLSKALPEGLFAGLAVALIEEAFFRGALYGAIRRESSMTTAAVLSSLYFAALHFLRAHELPADQPVGWASGLQVLATNFEQFTNTGLLDSFIALFAVGILLALVRERTGNIALCIGLHAGWVVVIKVTRTLTNAHAGADFAFLVGTYDGVTGWLATAWVALVAGVYWKVSRKASPTT